MAQVIFIVISGVVLLSALAVVNLPNVFHSALALTLTLLGVAALFAILGAGYIAVVQILVYVGAVAVLIILAIMVSERFMRGVRVPFNEQRWLGTAVAGGLFLVLAYMVASVAWPVTAQAPPADQVALLGEALLTEYLLPFEVASLVLLASLIGAIYIARE